MQPDRRHAKNGREGLRPARRRPRGLLLGALLSILLSSVAVIAASAQEGRLFIDASSGGIVRLEHETEWSASFTLDAGSTLLGPLPAGQYRLFFLPSAPVSLDQTTATGGTASSQARGGLSAIVADTERDEGLGTVQVWDGVTSRIRIDAQAHALRQWEGPEDASGATLLVPASILDALPGEPAEILAALDTHVRTRPGMENDGLQAVARAERRELAPGLGGVAGAASATLTPRFASGARWSLVTGTTDIRSLDFPLSNDQPPFHFTLGAHGSRHEDAILTGHARLDPRTYLGVPAGGHLWLRSAYLGNAAPSAVGDRMLDHNSANVLDLIARIDIGSPFAGALLGTGGGRTSEQGEGALGGDAVQAMAADGADERRPRSWGLALRLAATGYERDHYLQVYRRDLTHAPFEQTAFLRGEGEWTQRLGARTRGRLSLGYESYTNSFSDGKFERDLRSYYMPGGNAGADESGLYWEGPAGPLVEGHVYDYYRWHSDRELRAAAGLELACGHATRIEAALEASRLTYRRFEDFSPTAFSDFESGGSLRNSLLIGYDASRGKPSDQPFEPGRAWTARFFTRMESSPRARLHLEMAAGARLFSSGDSALASVAKPYGNDSDFDAGDWEAPVWHLRPEARLALARRNPGSADGTAQRGFEWWAIAFQRAMLPPLETLYSPRAYLAMSRPEGVMGNPALAPERETGGEAGIAIPFGLVPAGRLSFTGYASRLTDAITMEVAQVGPLQGWYGADWVPVYDNGGTLTQYGLHAEALTKSAGGRFWARLSYDLSRTQSDRYEPPLLDLRWLFPNRAPGEYESEGYAGPLGGITDELLGDPQSAGSRRPSNLDREHRLSLAAVARPAWKSGWLKDWSIGVIGRLETGRPFTVVFVYPAGVPASEIADLRGPDDDAWEQVNARLEPNDSRMPLEASVDLALSREFFVRGRSLRVGLEALNLFARKNPVAVYRATGEPDDDGCEEFGCLEDDDADVTEDAYAERILDPALYDAPLLVRGWVRFEIF
ncbi:MAG: hypothetical protein KBD56_07140 [Candidatus Eisenbacteria bacterium]|nr:hypothetical protein [Candidatus Eisenbacteria bacterium]